MKGIRVNTPERLGQLLSPLTYYLDQGWWYFGGNGVSDSPAPPDQPAGSAWERYLDESVRAEEELSKWVDDTHGFRVGRPGFFSRYGGLVDFEWTTQFASDAAECPYQAFTDADNRWGTAHFERPDSLPREIYLMTRDIDSAYVEFFFRSRKRGQKPFNRSLCSSSVARRPGGYFPGRRPRTAPAGPTPGS